MKIRPVGAELFLADRRTDMTKRIITFPNISNAPKGVSWRDRLKSFSLQHGSPAAQDSSWPQCSPVLHYQRVEIPVL